MSVSQALVDRIYYDPNFKRYTRHLKGIVKREQQIKKYIDGVVKRNSHKSSILVGPPGLGKSYIVLKSLTGAGRVSGSDYYTINGHITPVKLFATLYLFRAKGQILVLDDCDNIFTNEIGINILKAATDTTQNTVSYVSNHQIKVNGVVVQDFKFEGSVIICTNIDLSTGRGRQAEHMKAVDSRSTKITFGIESIEQKFAQLMNVVLTTNYLKEKKLYLNEQKIYLMLDYIRVNLARIKSLDLRLPEKIGSEMMNRKDWKEVCDLFIAS
jgi:hypothetical protein